MTETAKKAATKPAPAKAQKPAQEATSAPVNVWEALAAPFPQEDLERLPKALSRDDRNKGRCEDTDRGRAYSADGFYCGGWHVRSVHLTYVGHAGITTRLNTVLGPAGWEFGPMARTQEGLPLIARGEFWATLSVKDPETGEWVRKSDLAANFNSTQEAWGDALRRTAMRFGVGTYLWSKSEAAHAQAQYAEPLPDPPSPEPRPQAAPQAPEHVQRLQSRLGVLDDDQTAEVRAWWSDQGLPFLADLDEFGAAAVHSYLDEKGYAPANPQ